MIKRVTHLEHVSRRIFALDDRAPNRMNEFRIPLRTEASPTAAGYFCDPFVILKVLRNCNFPGFRGANFVVDPLQQTPAVGNVLIMNATATHRGIEAQAVEPVFMQPKKRV